MPIQITRTINQAVVRRIQSFADSTARNVHIGVPKGATSEDGKPIAPYAWLNEFGGEGHPARSFMRSTFNEQKGAWEQSLRKWLTGKATPQRLRRALTMIGQLAQQQIKAKIKSNVPPPNNPQYLAWKKANRKGGGYIGTLFLTGSMHNSIQYSLVDKHGKAVE